MPSALVLVRWRDRCWGSADVEAVLGCRVGSLPNIYHPLTFGLSFPGKAVQDCLVTCCHLLATFSLPFSFTSFLSLWQISISNALLNNSNFLISKHPSLKGNTPLPPHQGKCGKKVGEWCPRECQIQCGAWERIKMNMKFCQVHAFCSV